MIRTVVLAAMFTGVLIGVPGSAASSQAVAEGPAHAWYAGIGTGWYFPIQQWPTAYRLGGGGTLFAGRSLSDRWAVQVDANQWLLSGSSRSTWDFKSGPMLKWSARTRGAIPFVLAGVGIDAQTDYPSRRSTTSLMFPAGVGVEARSSSSSAIFAEVMHYVVARPVATRDLPLLVGFRLGRH